MCTNMSKTCNDCAFAYHLRCPTKPKEKTSWFFGKYVPSIEQEIYDIELDYFENWVACKRYPETVDKRKIDWCAEFKESNKRV